MSKGSKDSAMMSKGMIARVIVLLITAFIGTGFIYTMLYKGTVYEALFGDAGYFSEFENKSPDSYNYTPGPRTPKPSESVVPTNTVTPSLEPVATATPVITPSPSPSPSPTSTFVPLQNGMENSKVRELQTLLTKKGYYTGPITGYFGDLTEAAVKYFQGKNGLPKTGIVDQATMDKLRAAKDVM